MTGAAKILTCLQEAGLDFDVSRFDHRLMAQKLVYLLEEMGLELGYASTFKFYLRGTYSTKLTRDLFEAAARGKQGKGRGLTKKEKAAIAELRHVVHLRPNRLEAMAAYRFLRRQGHSETEALRIIRKTKAFLSDVDVAVGVSNCKSLFPEVTQEDLDSLAEEMAPWDAAEEWDDY